MSNLARLFPLLDDVQLPDALPYAQMSEWELQFLYLLGRHHLTGADALVELGSGGGGSTYALALGLQENPRFDAGTGRLHAYDFFRVGKGTFASEKFFTSGAAPEDGNSFLDDFRARLEPFLPFLEIHAGDIWRTSTRTTAPPSSSCTSTSPRRPVSSGASPSGSCRGCGPGPSSCTRTSRAPGCRGFTTARAPCCRTSRSPGPRSAPRWPSR
ncbi:hypothetical protein MBT84_17100 [Streptomyces sp. MBT84]|uniref:hypothetical protein n=1 Tax=Streptomyces sp. MBT84 TaxID=1488414 RepID=UPI001C6E290C|nr:hypothetical protein [Streptomyces sp. MBT84]MBW8701325.1 hypothetical protein [Streptomyces sp. MBT84]